MSIKNFVFEKSLGRLNLRRITVHDLSAIDPNSPDLQTHVDAKINPPKAEINQILVKFMKRDCGRLTVPSVVIPLIRKTLSSFKIIVFLSSGLFGN